MIENATSADERDEPAGGPLVPDSDAVHHAAWSHRRATALRVVQTFALALLIYLLILTGYVVAATLSQQLNNVNSRLDVPLRSTAFTLPADEAWLGLTLLAAVVVALNLAVASLAEAGQSSADTARPALYGRVYSLVLASRLAGVVAAMIGMSAIGSIFASDDRSPLGVLDLLAILMSSYLLVVISVDAREGMTPFRSYESARAQHQWRRRLIGIEAARRYWAPPSASRPLVTTCWWTLGLLAVLVVASVPVRLIRDGRFHPAWVPNVFGIAAMNLLGAAIIGLALAFAVLFDAITIVAVIVLCGAVLLGFELWPSFSFWIYSGDFPVWQRVVGLALNVFFRLACLLHVALWVGRRTWTLRRGDMIPLLSMLVDAVAGHIVAIMTGRVTISARINRYRIFSRLRRWYDHASGQAGTAEAIPAEAVPAEAVPAEAAASAGNP
ncbi:MAG TPA: hypothetical protein VFU36_02010 [Jatrophihabitans sp.]|nr:hypothetical protein [Jatrophihabitans sp.]